MNDEPVRALSDAQIRQFIQDGFVRLDRAFPRELADQGREIMWRDLPCDPDDPATWTQPVIRLGYYVGRAVQARGQHVPCSTRPSTNSSERGAGVRVRTSAPFRCGFRARTIPAMPAGMSMSAFPAKTAIPTNGQDFVVVARQRDLARPRAADAVPVLRRRRTRRADANRDRLASRHRAVAGTGWRGRHGSSGPGSSGAAWTGRRCWRPARPARSISCHPFLVHAAQMHRGAVPRFMAQPPLHPAEPFRLDREDGNYSPVEIGHPAGACSEGRG